MADNDLNASVYEAEVEHRLEHVRAYLEDLQSGRQVSVLLPLWNLRALQDESKQAGYRELSELCRRMETGIMNLHMRGGENDKAVIAEIAETAAAVREYAHRAVLGVHVPGIGAVRPWMEVSA